MSQKPISEFHRRMLEDMAVRNFSEAIIRNYIRHIVVSSWDVLSTQQLRRTYAVSRCI